MCALFCKVAGDLRKNGCDGSSLSRSLDLSSAYRQLSVFAESIDYSYICLQSPPGQRNIVSSSGNNVSGSANGKKKEKPKPPKLRRQKGSFFFRTLVTNRSASGLIRMDLSVSFGNAESQQVEKKQMEARL